MEESAAAPMVAIAVSVWKVSLERTVRLQVENAKLTIVRMMATVYPSLMVYTHVPANLGHRENTVKWIHSMSATSIRVRMKELA